MAMTIMLTGNFTGMSPEVLTTWSNPEVVAINQDPLGAPTLILNATVVNKTDGAATSPMYTAAVSAPTAGDVLRFIWYNDANLVQ